jgi:hypothetical protein
MTTLETMMKVQWINAYERGLEQANQQNKPMLLNFFKEG